MKEKPDNAYLSIGAYARAYGVSRRTVYKWLESGMLEHYKVLGLVRIKNVNPREHATRTSA